MHILANQKCVAFLIPLGDHKPHHEKNERQTNIKTDVNVQSVKVTRCPFSLEELGPGCVAASPCYD